MKYSLEYVTYQPHLWENSDPVRPDLDVRFKTAQGREVLGLIGDDGQWKAFMCYARTTDIPRNIEELDSMTSEVGENIIPYTVWSIEKGAGRAIINKVIQMVKDTVADVYRVVTLSPRTEMARLFHLRNSAKELRVNTTTVNFEYDIERE